MFHLVCTWRAHTQRSIHSPYFTQQLLKYVSLFFLTSIFSHPQDYFVFFPSLNRYSFHPKLNQTQYLEYSKPIHSHKGIIRLHHILCFMPDTVHVFLMLTVNLYLYDVNQDDYQQVYQDLKDCCLMREATYWSTWQV